MVSRQAPNFASLPAIARIRGIRSAAGVSDPSPRVHLLCPVAADVEEVPAAPGRDPRGRSGTVPPGRPPARPGAGLLRLPSDIVERRETGVSVGSPPTGTVTFVFTDIEASTRHWERDPAAMRTALAIHDEVVRRGIEARGGMVFAEGGDGVAAAFPRADQAVAAALDLQRAITSAAWPTGTALEVRVGLHTGECVERDGNYVGPAVNRAARVMDAANGSQIFLSGTTADVVAHALPPGAFVVDLGHHDLRDVLESVRLLRLEHPDIRLDRRPPRTGGARAGNLPVASGPLLGRAADLDRITEDLRSERIVTLTGVGGVGKTRLAIEAGRRVQPERRDGVWLASLGDVDRPSAMLDALLGVFGMEPRTGSTRLDALVEGLRFRHAILVLDSCEHLIDAVAEVSDAVSSSCPDVQILATSREPLDVEGERVRRVRSLATDGDGPAAALFFLRATAAGADIDRTADAATVGEICARLDGIPLAIELAAARTRSLRPAQVLERLDDMFSLLTGGRRRGVERHRTLRATLEWSYDLLTEPERAMLARLAVFVGSFSVDAAEAVAGDVVEPDGLVDVIDQLVGRSLLEHVEEAGDGRFRLLEPVRQFAAERLVERSETEAARDAHARFYADLLADLSDRWRTGDDQATWPAAARELANLRLAFDRMVEAGQVDEAQRLTVAGFGPIVMHVDYVPEFDWAPRATAMDPGHVGPWTASACAVAAWGAMSRGDTDAAADLIRAGVAALSGGSTDDGLVTASALHNVVFGGELVVDGEFLERSVAAALASGDLHRQVWVLSYSGRGEQAVEAAERLGNQVLLLLARSALAPRDEQERWNLLEDSWELAQRSHSFIMRNMAAHELGALHVRDGAPLDGLLLLRTPARDWLLRGDARVWDVLYSIAAGLAVLGDAQTAAVLRRAIGDRHIGTVVSRHERNVLEAAVDRCVGDGRPSGEPPLDAGAAVELALGRIETLATDVADAPAGAEAEPVELTARQLEVADLVAHGLSNKAIATRLGISRFTVETHVRNILDRIDATSRTQIARWVIGRVPT